MRQVLLISILMSIAAFAAQDPVDGLIDEVVRSASTDAARAAALYEAADIIEEKAVRIRFLSKAVDYGLKGGPKGLEVAEKAIDAIIALAPDQAAVWEEKRLVLYRRWLADPRRAREKAPKLVEMLLAQGRRHEKAHEWKQASALYNEAASIAMRFKLAEADQVKLRMRLAMHMNKVWTRVETLKKSLESNAANKPARRSLLLALVADADAPAEAAKHLTDDLEAAWRENVPVAARPVKEVDADDCLRLARWYYSDLGPLRDPYARFFTRRRAKQYAERFLSLHEAKDVKALKARTVLVQAEKDLEKLSKQLGMTAGGNVPRKGLVLHLSFRKDGGERAVDLSGNKNDAKVMGAKWTPKGRAGGAYLFDGDDDYLVVGASRSIKMQKMVSVCAWFMPAIFGGYRNILSDHAAGGNNGKILRLQGGRIEFMMGPEGSPDVGFTLPGPGRWYHAVAVFDGAAMHMYINGVKTDSRPHRAAVPVNPNPLLIGKSGFREHFRGVIDEVMLYDHALTEKEVRQIYRAQGGK